AVHGRLRARTRAQGRQRDALYFFFQAEDGIRDKLVTGVQTCALPISFLSASSSRSSSDWIVRKVRGMQILLVPALAKLPWLVHRSEERRVGKECRSRWSA